MRNIRKLPQNVKILDQQEVTQNSMFNLPFFGRKKLLLAFEYGLTIAETARAQRIPLTPELVAKAEVMIENEARTQNESRFATQMVPNILSVFELDLSK